MKAWRRLGKKTHLKKLRRDSKLYNFLRDILDAFDYQYENLFEKHNNSYDTITDDEIMDRYYLITKYIYSDDFVELSKSLKKNKNN